MKYPMPHFSVFLFSSFILLSYLILLSSPRYAPETAVHDFLRDRLHHLNVDTLSELHYLLITLGKVVCAKRAPNWCARASVPPAPPLRTKGWPLQH